MNDRWRCAEPWCEAEWTGRPEDGYPHPPEPADPPERVLDCGHTEDDHIEGGRCEVLA